MYRLQISPRQAIDQVWFTKLTTILSRNREIFLLLEPSVDKLESQQAAFVASLYESQPDLRPDTVEVVELGMINEDLKNLLIKIGDTEPNKIIREAYIARISEAILENEIVLSACNSDGYTFMANNARLYGRPSSELFRSCCAWIRSNASATRISSLKLSKLRQKVLDAIPDFPDANPSALLPNESTFKKVKDLHQVSGGYIDQLFAPQGLPESAYIDEATGSAVCQQAIVNIGSDYHITSSTDGIWAVRQSTKQVVFPSGYRLDRNEYAGIICHEVGSHLLESVNGSRQPLRLLSLGLDRYEAGNEGRAFLREQIMYDSERQSTEQASWEYIVLLYLGVSLGSGVARSPYTFARLYEVFYALYSFWRERRYPMASNNELFAREEAWRLAVRLMKGTGPKMTGAGCYMKDTVYLQGNIDCWQVASTRPEMILFGDVGKFNISNAEHVSIVRQLCT